MPMFLCSVSGFYFILKHQIGGIGQHTGIFIYFLSFNKILEIYIDMWLGNSFLSRHSSLCPKGREFLLFLFGIPTYNYSCYKHSCEKLFGGPTHFFLAKYIEVLGHTQIESELFKKLQTHFSHLHSHLYCTNIPFAHILTSIYRY